MKTYKVFIDGISKEISENEFKNYNVIVNKSNGYSHDFQSIEKFEKEKHFRTEICLFTNRNLNYIPTHLTTKNPTIFLVGTSTTTFS
jgi:hypothetical protein